MRPRPSQEEDEAHCQLPRHGFGTRRRGKVATLLNNNQSPLSRPSSVYLLPRACCTPLHPPLSHPLPKYLILTLTINQAHLHASAQPTNPRQDTSTNTWRPDTSSPPFPSSECLPPSLISSLPQFQCPTHFPLLTRAPTPQVPLPTPPDGKHTTTLPHIHIPCLSLTGLDTSVPPLTPASQVV